jgi:hypothetical protein
VAFKAGTVTYIGLDNAAGAVQNVSPYGDNFSWPQPIDMLEVSAFGTSAKAFIPGLTDGAQVTISGPADAALATQLAHMKGTMVAGGSTFSLLYGPLGSVSGLPKVSAETLVASFEYSAGVGGRVDFSATLQVTGALTNSVW